MREVCLFMLDVMSYVLREGRNILVACILLALFLGSVTYEVLSVDPRRRAIALVAAVVVAALVFLLLLQVVH